MDIKEVVKTAILRNSHEWGDEQAEAVLKAINEAGFVLVPVTPSDEFIDKLADVICSEFCTTISGSAHCATEAYKLMIEAQELANEL